jgi:2-C-methyl-D-erythritol 4-phosphate cytidylyltransferase
MSPSSRSDSTPDTAVVIAAAGASRRAGPGEPKPFRPIRGVPMLLRSLAPFARHPRVAVIIVALPAAFARKPPAWLAELVGERVRLVAGGATRTESVRLALAALRDPYELVLVHDAARPFVADETIDAVIATAARGVCAVPAIAVADTLKRVDAGSMLVRETVARSGLWRAQTPQGFPRRMLEEAYRRARGSAPAAVATDEASLAEASGFPVELIPDRSSNIKVTTPDDFQVAEALASL